jgi:hypothetical protein
MWYRTIKVFPEVRTGKSHEKYALRKLGGETRGSHQVLPYDLVSGTGQYFQSNGKIFYGMSE